MMDAKNVTRVVRAFEYSLGCLRNHSFVRMALRKELTKEQAHHWIMAAGWDSREFRTMLARLVEKLVDQSEHTRTYQILLENLNDENGNGNPEEAHWRHYVHLAQQLGYTEQELLGYVGRGGVQFAVGMARNVPHWNIAKAVGYMLVNEGATPITYGAEEIALRAYHPTLETDFFQLHVAVDDHHVEELIKVVSLLPNESVDEVLEGIEAGESGMAAILAEAIGWFGPLHLTVA